MRSVSNYLSMIIILTITLLLTYHFSNYIESMRSNAENILMNKDMNINYSVFYENDTKIIVIDKNGCEPWIDGIYTVLYNSTDKLIIQANIDSAIIVVTGDDIIEI